MLEPARPPGPAEIAAEVLSSLGDRRQIPTFSGRPDASNLADPYGVMPLLRTAFEARGETVTGRKIGFANRRMWAAYGVQAPIWGYCTDRTTGDLADTRSLRASDFVAPRIEPEIMFGLSKAPMPDMDESALLDCIDWIALGYEIVQSIFPEWKFAVFDAIVANALHGAVLVGNHQAVAPRRTDWPRELATFSLELRCNGEARQNGGGALVLDSPLLALRHLVGLLADDPRNPPLSAGEIVSSGTLTVAMPVGPGETWTASVDGIPLEDITLRFEA